MKLTQKKFSEAVHICVYGGPKVGKTELVGKLSQKFKLMWFDLERGAATLTKLPVEWQERIELVSLADTRVFPIGIETMLKVIKGGLCKICDTHGKVNCPACLKSGGSVTEVELNSLDPAEWVVVLDSGTQLSNSAMAQVTRGQPDDYKFEWDDYRKQGTLMDIFLSQVQQAPFSFVFITHEAEVDLEDGKKKLVPVAGTTNFSRNTAKYFDHVVRAEIKNKKHAFGSSTTFSLNALTGSRTDVEIEKASEASLIPFFETTSKKQEAGIAVVEQAVAAPVEQPAANASLAKLAALRAGKK